MIQMRRCCSIKFHFFRSQTRAFGEERRMLMMEEVEEIVLEAKSKFEKRRGKSERGEKARKEGECSRR